MTHTISQNLNLIQQKITSACRRTGRSPNEIQLVAVTKYAELGWVQALIDLGYTDLGESRPQQLSERCAMLSDSITWHMIGHLQRNKVRPVLETGAIIHSVDSQRLLERIESLAQEMNVTAEVFIEVNTSREPTKHGFSPDEVSSVAPLLKDSRHIKALGMMTMAPYAEDLEESRPYFRELRELQTLLNMQLPDDRKLSSLSMGMSGDFVVAIEEGATHIRIGSALFEGLSND